MAYSATAEFNPVLSEMLNKIGENRFVGTQILPIRDVGTKTGEYPVFDSDQFDNDASKERASGTDFARRDFAYGQQSYKCVQYGLEGVLPDEDRTQANDDGISDVEASIAKALQRDLMVGHERRVKDVVFPSSTPFNSTAATAAMSAKSTAKPIEDIQLAVKRLHANGHFDNLAVIIEESLYQEMLNVDDVRTIFNGNGQYTDPEVLRAAFGVDRFIVCPTRYNSAAKGKSASRTSIWPIDKYLVGQVTGGDFSNGGFGRTLAYSPDGGSFSAENYRDEKKKSDILRVFNSVDEVVINSTAAELITGA